ncbi:MAG TPA: tetratricopeptide repeat protein [Candidatus Baltobacteraceae bacterium]|jgi:tetratricopeptide (TPR) repeat protein|nr:tetratricopeptide repeat protein [Candidatus Baltobacteraceae bacterium]
MIDRSRRNVARWVGAGLAFATLAVFLPAIRFQFTTYDDPDFVTANPHVQAGLTAESFKWAWRSEVARNWHPITMLTHMLDCQLCGVKPGWPHFVNILLHAANAVLLFYLLKRMTGTIWRSAFVAALFALHPLHVESVAWVAERKDVLSTFFWFLTILAYVRYADAEKNQNSKFKFYCLALVLFAVGLMCKPMLVTVPFALLLLDYWPLGRMKRVAFGRLVAEKIPFMVLSAALCVVTYSIQQRGGSVLSVNNLPMSYRIGNAFVSYWRYIGKMFWPENLAGLYLRSGNWPGWEVALAAGLLVAVSAIAVWQCRRRPWLAVGWFWYVGTLVPVIGIVQAGMQTMADRYTYVPLTGIFIILAWGGCELANVWRAQRLAAGVAAAALAVCAALTAHQLTFWKDSETLFRRMIDATPNNYMAHYNLGNLYSREGKIDAAAANYEAALQEEPNYADAHNNLGGILLDQKRYDEALAHYRAAVVTNPEFAHYLSLANALADAASARHDTNEFAQAVAAFEEALRLNPNASEAHHNLGLTWQAEGSNSQAIAEFEEAARLDPNRLDSWSSLAMCCAMQNRMAEAEAAFRQVVRLRPDDWGANGNLGNALAAQSKLEESIPFYLTALRLNPKDYQTEFNLGLTYSREGRRAEAEAHYRQALRINPNYTEARRALGQLQAVAPPQ